MREVIRGWASLAVLLILMGGCAQTAMAQVPVTKVQDVVYSASGAAASGSVVVSWGTFTTANGDVIEAGSTAATLGAGGALSIALAPNAGATPMGSYYTAVFHLSDGTTSKQYWVVPVTVPGGGPAKLAGIENSVLPTSVAMQTVSKQYVDNEIARAQIGGVPLDASPYVVKAGDTMTGPLVLPGDPVSPLQAADKNYVDENVTAITGGLGQTVRTLPTATQAVTQPSGTLLGVNNLNGELYASQYQSSTGGDGIANALVSPDCGSTCKVVVEPTYGEGEPLDLGHFQTGLVVEDQRGGSDQTVAVNPLGPANAFSAARSVIQYSTITQQQLQAARPGAQAIGVAAEQLATVALTGGTNLDPTGVESPPNFKSTFGVLALTGVYNTQGQHIQLNSDISCYGVGDCLAGGQFITSSGGYRDPSDEGTHPYDLEVTEDFKVFGGGCTSGCTPGSTTVGITPSVGGGTQGDGRFLLDTAPSKTISGTTLTGGGYALFPVARFTGTNFPVSVFLSTAATVVSQATNVAPGTVTVPIATTALQGGFQTNTAALPATSGVACIADPATKTQFPDYEMAAYTVVDATHLQMTLNKPHIGGAVIAVGGLCGYGLNQTVDDVGVVKQVFPVVGSSDGTDLYYAGALTGVVGLTGASSTSAFFVVNENVASIARSGGVVTVTTAGNLPGDVNGLTLTVSGVTDPSYDGSFTVTSTGYNSFTYASAGANSTSSGGAVSALTGGFNLYPMAEVLSVYNPVSNAVDGTFTLAANTVNWAVGDSVEEPHYFQQNTSIDSESVTQYLPRPVQYVQGGKFYAGNVTAGLRGWQITNNNGANYYLGGGGTHNMPDDAHVVSGPWRNDFELDAGAQSVMYVHCNPVRGCGRWDSTYYLFQLDSAVGSDYEQYQPQSSTVTWDLQGTPYSFSPSAFTAGTINVGTLNATTINGGVSGSAITTGTVSAARLPLFGPSGATHASGIVPDPGATAGATRFLREDGTWNVPAGGGTGGGGSPSGTAGGDLAGSYPNPTVAAVHATNGASFASSGSGPVVLTQSNDTTACNPPSTFTNQEQVVGSLDAGMFYGYDANTSSACIGALQPGVGWDSVLLQPVAGTVGILAPNGTPLSANLTIGSAPGASSKDLRVLEPLTSGATSKGYTLTVPTGGGLQIFRYNGISDGSAPIQTTNPDGSVTSGYATAPSGSCSANGAWVLSQDGHATFCAGGTWVTKI